MNKSQIESDRPVVQVKNASQLKRLAQAALPSWRNLRILTDDTDNRSHGNRVAICEQDQQGKLTILVGAPDFTVALSFLKNAIEDGRVK